MTTETVASPCISVCAIDDSEICIGCYRTLDEIQEWSSASRERKQQILKKSNIRREIENNG
jgi:predicted Fe-S protein YdhL (DUF1289 family)